MFLLFNLCPQSFKFGKHQKILVGGKLQRAVAVGLETYRKFRLRDFIDNLDVFLMLLGAIEVFPCMNGLKSYMYWLINSAIAISAKSPCVLFPISRIVKMLLKVVIIKCGFLLISSLKRAVKS